MYVVGIASSRKQEQILLLVLTTWGTHSRLGLGWADRITTLHQRPCGDAGNSRRTYSNSKRLIQNGSARTLSCAIAAPLFLFLFFVRWVGGFVPPRFLTLCKGNGTLAVANRNVAFTRSDSYRAC